LNDRQAAAVTESEAQRAWVRVRSNLRESAGARLFEQWLKPMELIEDGDTDTIRLGLPSAFMTNWVRNHYADRMMLEFRALLPNVRGVSIETCVPAPVAARIVAGPADAAPAPTPQPAPPLAAIVAAKPAGERPPLDARFTFDRFVVDAANRVAFNAARVLAEPGVPRFSPLFLHSGTGQGKTHLMHAIGHAFLAQHPTRPSSACRRSGSCSISSRRCARATRTASNSACAVPTCC